jgi:thioredoxin 1
MYKLLRELQGGSGPVRINSEHESERKVTVMSEHVREVNDASFEKEVLESGKPVLVDFWAPWCGPCRMIAPLVDAVADEYKESAVVVKVNVDDNPSISQRYGIKGIPTLILFRSGKEEERVVGATSKDALSRLVGKHVALVSA